MSEWMLLIVGLIVGGLIGWLAASASRERQIRQLQQEARTESEQRIAAQTELRQANSSLEEQKNLLKAAREELSTTFNALAAEALKSNNQAFIALAKSAFETVQAEAKGDLETRQKAIDGLVAPLKESLERYEKQIQAMEQARQKAYGSLEEQVRSLATESQRLQKETGSLATALRTPQVRGRWGEMTLRRVAELAGMSEHCDFSEKEALSGEAGQQYPDMIVHLPGGRRIAVDSKVPLQAFLDALSATTEREREDHYARHSQLVRAHMNQLGAKRYWEQFDPAPDFVVLFLPGESFFSAALEQDRTLIEDGMQKRVLVSTPTTLIALLRAVAYGWRQERLTQNAQEISDRGMELYERIKKFAEHFEGIGSALRKAVETYNDATGSLERRVLVSARKFKEMGAATGEEIAVVEPIDETPRVLAARERNEAE